MKDIAPELLENIQKEFDEKFKSNKKINSLHEKLKEGVADYDDAQSFAKETGKVLAEVFQNNLSSDVLPDGRMYYNIANRIIPEMLKLDYDLVSAMAVEVQHIVNESAGIGIKARAPKLNEEKVTGIVNIVSGKLIYDQIAYMLKDPVINFSQCIVDDTVRENADFQHESGLNPKIVRTVVGKCCEWCNNIAGVYDYEDIKQKKNHDVFRRHKHCDCKVEYLPGDGRKQNVHTKKWSRELSVNNNEEDFPKRLSNLKERSKIIREAIDAPKPVYAEDLRVAYKTVKPKDGYMDICLHGTPSYTEYEHKYILDNETLALIISGRRDYRPDLKDIRLLSCSTGKEDARGDCVAQELANILGVYVYAPIDTLYIQSDGSLRVGDKWLNEENGFKLFKPRKVTKNGKNY